MSFAVEPIPAAGALCTLAQVKERTAILDTDSDALIQSLIPLALQRLNLATGREFIWTGTAETRTFETTSRHLSLFGSDLRTCTAVILDPLGAAKAITVNTGYILRPSRLTGTNTAIRFADASGISSYFSRQFGMAQVAVTGDWGIWEDISTVPADINEAAIECVLSWIDKPISDIAGIDSLSPRGMMPSLSPMWDIPMSAWRKLQPYNVNLGAY